MKPLARRSDLWGWALTLHCWGVIAACMLLSAIWPVLAIPSFFIIGSRQLGLSILTHEAAHNTLFDSRALNRHVGQWLLSIPWGGDRHSYQAYHFKHHANTQTDDDPDLHLSAKFPTTRASLARKLTRDITGLTGLKLRYFQIMSAFTGKAPLGAPDRASTLAFLAVNIAAFTLFAVSGHAWIYLTLWLLPLLTWFQLVLRIRNIAEHGMTTRDGNVLTTARTTEANLLARIFLAPYWVNYHVEHHAYMYVPCYRLKAAHQQMRAHPMERKPGYGAVLKSVITPATRSEMT